MNEQLPYEQEQWANLPLPDENMAWADMKRRLEEEDDDGIIVFLRSGCAMWGLLALLLLGAAWWLLQSHEWFTTKPHRETHASFNNKDTAIVPVTKENKHTTYDTTGIREETVQKMNDGVIADISGKHTIASPAKKPLSHTMIISPAKNKTVRKRNKSNKKNTHQYPMGDLLQQYPAVPANPHDLSIIQPANIHQQQGDVIIDSLQQIKDDTITTTNKDAIAVKKDAAKKDSAKKRPVYFSTGIAMHQQLPVAGQQSTPYNSQGRKGSLADYIPTVYVRINKKDKWFVQAEFKYGAPQNTRQFTYRQIVVPDSGAPAFSTTIASSLRKTYYHQLPVTFNYLITPRWSLGTGIVWNKFHSAIVEEEVNRNNSITGIDSLISKKIKQVKKDTGSAFVKHYFQAVIETNYQWKRFSFGARYAFGLEPYIKFQLPGRPAQQERNSNLQLFIRYELWRSKKGR